MPKSKYLAKKVEVDGIEFDSKKEANHYLFLKSQQEQGLISSLRVHVPFELIPTQYEEVIKYTPKHHKEKKVKRVVEKSVVYYADFVYDKNGERVVEDTKGYKFGTAYAVFVIKRKLMRWLHGIQVVEV